MKASPSKEVFSRLAKHKSGKKKKHGLFGNKKPMMNGKAKNIFSNMSKPNMVEDTDNDKM